MYREVAAIDVELSADRGIFDRMLATDQETAAARWRAGITERE
jgi:hypothetical protein